MLDDAALPLVDSLVAQFKLKPPFLTFDSLSMAHALSARYGRTVLAGRGAFSRRHEQAREASIEVQVAGPEDALALPPGRFGLVHLRWTPVSSMVLLNAMRWLRPGGVLLVEAPDSYPALSLPRSPYQAVASAVVGRLPALNALDVPARLIGHGFVRVGCGHVEPEPGACRGLLGDLVEEGAPWPDLLEVDVRDWSSDPAADTPFLVSVSSWGMKSHL